jgi:uncharacterized protein (TIGR00730 family)
METIKSEITDEVTQWESLEKLLLSVAKEQKPARLQILGDIFKAVLKLTKESPGTLNLKITSTVLKELRYSFKMFYPHRFTPKITIFGSARVPSDTPLYASARKFAVEAVKRNYMIITGGGPGIMAAGNEGAEKAGFGLNIRLPVEQTANPFIDQKNMLIHYKYFFTRKLFLVKEASAFVFFPGGFGTFDEAFEALTLLQTGKSNIVPVVFFEPKGFGFWEAFHKFVKNDVAARGFISASDESLYRVMNDPEEALDHIDGFYRVYHSMRFVKQEVVLRLNRPLTAPILKKLTQEFGFLSIDGKFKLSEPLPEEDNEPELKALSRLVFPFDRRDFGSLRRLIDFINTNAV